MFTVEDLKKIVLPFTGILLSIYAINASWIFLPIIVFTIFNISVFSKFVRDETSESASLVKIPLIFVLSNLAVTLLTILISSVFPTQLPLNVAIYSAYILSFLLLITLNLLSVTVKKIQKSKKGNKDTVIALAFILLSLTISHLIFNDGLKLNQSINIDAYHHLTAIKEIFRNGNYAILLTSINDTFTLATYLPIFHYIFGLPISAVPLTETVLAYRLLEILFSGFSALIVYKSVRVLTKSLPLAVMAAVLHLFAFESFGAYTSFFLLPQTLAALFGVALVSYVLSIDKINLPLLSISSVIMVLTHFLIGPFFIFIITALLLFKRFNKSLSGILSVSIFVLLFLVVTSEVISLDISQAIGQIYPDFAQRVSELVPIGTIDLVNIIFRDFGFLAVLPIFYLIYGIFEKDWKVKGLVFITAVTMFIISIKFPYSNKLLLAIHYSLILITAIKLSQFKFFQLPQSVFLVALMIPGLAFSLKVNSDTFKDIFRGRESNTVIMSYEYELANTLNQEIENILLDNNYKEILIISDPLTMHMLEPIVEAKSTGGLFTKVEIRIQNWEFLRELEENQKKLRERAVLMSEGIETEDTSEFSQEFLDFYNKNLEQGIYTRFVFTPRTKLWMAEDREFIEGYGNQIWNVESKDVQEEPYVW